MILTRTPQISTEHVCSMLSLGVDYNRVMMPLSYISSFQIKSLYTLTAGEE